jgi:DNA-binding NtrC family response regulator/nitrogen-specific signal transduction histidine kinase
MDTIRVLYAEDDPADRELTTRHLARHAPHLKLDLAPTVSEALDRLEGGAVDLVLSDFRLPDGTGLDVLEAVKARNLTIPVVLVTGSGDVESAVRLLKAGAANYVVKRPGYLQSLPSVINDAYRWYASSRELRRASVRVLYVEHEPADIELTRRAFQEHGRHLELEVVPRGRMALERLRTMPYDLLFLDYRMPDMSGIEVLKTIREEGLRVPVVIVTGQGDEETAVQAFKLGAADYVVKRPGYLARLLSTLESVLNQQRLADEKDALLVLNSLTRSIATVRELGDLTARVTRAAVELLHAESGVLWLRHDGELRPSAWLGLGDAEARALVRPLDAEAAVRLASDRRVDLGALLGAASLTAPAALDLVESEQTAAVSLESSGSLVGVLAVASRRPRQFKPLEERLLTVLADHSAVAIENTRLYEELKNRHEELRRTQAQLLQTEKIAAMGQLLAGVAHELNNPLSVVIGQARLLEMTTSDAADAERSRRISAAAERCGRIVKNFLALARQHAPERQAADLNQVVRDALELVGYQLRVASVEVTVELAVASSALWADPHQLHQVVLNLITNAHHAMREASGPRLLRVATHFDDAHARIEVTDTGPGIPADVLPRIFEPFFTTKSPGQGTGLGLSLCQGMVEAHGGIIRVDTEVGRGTTFVVELPIQSLPALTINSAAREMPAPMRRGRILVVDDEPVVLEVLAGLLGLQGHEVETVGSGDAALERIAAASYDLIFSDVRMPGLDGPGLYREISARHPALLSRLIYITGDTLSPDVEAFLSRTSVTCLTKPFALDDLERVVGRFLTTGP